MLHLQMPQQPAEKPPQVVQLPWLSGKAHHVSFAITSVKETLLTPIAVVLQPDSVQT
jgi:hypothetical protein